MIYSDNEHATHSARHSGPRTAQEILLTLAEAQELLRVSHWTLQRLLNERRVASVRIGRRRFIRRVDLDAFINASLHGVPDGAHR